MYGHQDDDCEFEDLPRDSQLNVLCDLNAKPFLQEQIANEVPSPLSLPDERSTVAIRNLRLSTDIGEGVRRAVTYENLRQYRCRGKFDTVEGFIAVDWNAVAKSCRSFPQQFQLWITKHVSGCNASNKLQVHLG